MHMTWTVIVNPVAGRGRTRKLLPAIEERAAAFGAKVQVSLTAEDPIRLAHEAAELGHNLVACGGDGLVAAVAGVAADTGRTLAVVPTGAGNDFARGLGYDPKNALQAFDALESGRDRVIDLGRVNGRYFTCTAYSGFDAEANRWANTVTKLSGTALYVAAVLRTLAVYKPHPFRLTVDGETHEHRAWLVAVGNGPAYGGGMNIAPNASLDDGLLDITVVGAMTRVQMLTNFPKVFKGTHISHPLVTTYRAARVELESLDAAVPMDAYADGERVGPLPATMEAAPHALTVRVPE
jgi:diacylglycerol kinase (ATP)